MEKHKRNQSIDLIKIIAMMGVMALHTCINRTDELPGFILSRTFGLSIPLFFMVSGYLMQGRNVDYKYSIRKIWGILRFTFIMCFAYWFIHSVRHEFDIISFIKLWIGSFLQRGPFGLFWYFGSMILLYLILPYYNRLEQEKQLFLPRIIICLLAVVFCFFMADYVVDIEKLYIPQTFRLWYWLLFFSLGQMFRKILMGGYKLPMNLGIMFVANIMLLTFVWLSRKFQPGIEYFFGSNLMIFYACAVFGEIAQYKMHNTKIIQQLSKLFLPVYALHSFVITFVLTINITSSMDIFSVLGDYLLVAIITLTLSWGLMKIPYMDKVFKI